MPESHHVEPLSSPLACKRKVPTSNRIDMDRICKLLKVQTLEDFRERIWDLQAEEESETVNAYIDAVMYVMKECFDKHGLELVAVRPKGKRALKDWDPDRAWEYRVQPCPGRDWCDCANNIRATINGVGMFGFASLHEFLDSGPYTAREAVLTHLGWCPDWYDVYEGGKASSRVERRLR